MSPLENVWRLMQRALGNPYRAGVVRVMSVMIIMMMYVRATKTQ